MTENVPENMENIYCQRITVETDGMQAVYADGLNGEPDRVFFNLESMVAMLSSALLPLAMGAVLSGEPYEQAKVEGALWVIDSLKVSLDSLRDEAVQRGFGPTLDVTDLEAAFSLPSATDTLDG